MKYFIITLSILIGSLSVKGQDFDTYFTNQTLRLDYLFAGSSNSQSVALDQLSQLPQWAGKRHNLSKILRDGNGQINVIDIKTGESIYKESFSSLFQEWQTTPEAEKLMKSFENTFLVPFPKDKVLIELSLRNNMGLYDVMIKHKVDPKDILIRKKGFSNVTPYTVIHQGDSINKCVNVAILAEGYTAEQMVLFRTHAKTACEAIFSHAPFDKLKNKINIFAVETVSKDTGVSVPHKQVWKTTAFGSHFDTFYSERYLTTTHVKDIHDAVAGIPYGHIIILANTDVYGGGGIFNAYTLTTTGHPSFKPVVVHEFGHSFAGLADEYYYDKDVLDNTYTLDVEPWEANITTLIDFGAKWKNMLAPQTPVPTSIDLAKKYKIGVFEGAGYKAKGIYRGAIDCRMKTNTATDFCPVCQRAIEEIIKFDTE